jgi:type II secretory pathway pseudopilin PulG
MRRLIKLSPTTKSSVMGKLVKQPTLPPRFAFTRLELIVVLACFCVLGLVALPMLGRSHNAGTEAVCMNNLRNLGRAMLIYCDQNRGFVPEEGNIANTIFTAANSDAWYNVATVPAYPSMKSLYTSGQYPLPGNGSIYSCPAAPLPPAGQPSLSWAFFMYGENSRICVNQGTRTTLGQSVQTKIATLPRPSLTILMAEVDDNYPLNAGNPALSGTTAHFTPARHNGFGLFNMCDGSVRAFTTSEFNHPESTALQEWSTNGALTSWPCYWWPSPTTPN